MAYDPGALEAALAAVVGEDAPLIAELRGAFFASAEQHLSTMANAGDDAAWQDAALRLKGLAASFGALGVMRAASRAADMAHDDAAIALIRRALDRIAA